MIEITQLTPRLWISWEIVLPVGVFLTGSVVGCERTPDHAQKSDSLCTTGSAASAEHGRTYGESHDIHKAR